METHLMIFYNKDTKIKGLVHPGCVMGCVLV